MRRREEKLLEWSADNFGLLHSSPPHSRKMTIRKQNKKFDGDVSKLLVQSYFINTSRAGAMGKHCLLLLCAEKQPPVHSEKQDVMLCVSDPLGKAIKSYPSLFDQLQKISKQSKHEKARGRTTITPTVFIFKHLRSILLLRCSIFDTQTWTAIS